jgi:hypothetical protein
MTVCEAPGARSNEVVDVVTKQAGYWIVLRTIGSAQSVGDRVGASVGATVGEGEGSSVGPVVGEVVGCSLGSEVTGSRLGLSVGESVGAVTVGAGVGFMVGEVVGPEVGLVVGPSVGREVTGESVGLSVGIGVGSSWQYVSTVPQGSTPFQLCVTEPTQLPSETTLRAVTAVVTGMVICSKTPFEVSVSCPVNVTSIPW